MKTACTTKPFRLRLVSTPNARVSVQAVDESGEKQTGQRDQWLTQTFRDHWRELCQYVRGTFGGGPPEPEDVVQEAFARFTALEDPGKVQNPRAFLYSTARNIVIDHKRRDKKLEGYIDAVLHMAGQDMPDQLSLEAHLINAEHVEIMQQAIDRLPARQRKALLLNRLHGHSYNQIVKTTGWSRSEIGRQIARAIEIISRAFNDREASDKS